MVEIANKVSLALALTLAVVACGDDGDGSVGVDAAGGNGPDAAVDRSWQPVTSPVTADLEDVILELQTGFAVGRSGTVIATADAGQTWTTRTSGTTADLVAVGRFATGGRDLVYAAGAAGTIVLSTDGGASFAVKRTGPEALVAIGAFTRDGVPTFAAVGNDGGAIVLLTSTDEMATWQRRTVRAGARANHAGFAVAEGVVVGDAGLLLGSTDRGATWAPVALDEPITRDLRRVSGPEPRIVGDGIIAIQTMPAPNASWTLTEGAAVPALVDEDGGLALGTAAGATVVVELDPSNLSRLDVRSLGTSTGARAIARSSTAALLVGAGGKILRRAP